MAEGPQALKKDPLSEIAAPRGGLFFWCCPMDNLYVCYLYYMPFPAKVKRCAESLQTGRACPLYQGTTVSEKIRLCSSRVGLTGTPVAPPLGATATTAASGGNREELLGQRPAGCKRQRSRRWVPQPGLWLRSRRRELGCCRRGYPPLRPAQAPPSSSLSPRRSYGRPRRASLCRP